MSITTLRHTEGLTAVGTARVRCAAPFGTTFATTTGFGTAMAYAAAAQGTATTMAVSPIASPLLDTPAIDWRMNERKSGNSSVDLHLPWPPDSCP